jgi:acetylornithine deacetylase/succinyl-diaminopimelate desuccinylase-like protein
MKINWPEVREEATRILIDLIRLNTVNPPGNETEAALYLQRYLQKEGVEAAIYASASNRGNLVAVLPGSGQARPLVLLGHLDVVAANPKDWSHPPFDAVIADDFIWGRGALDMKGMLAMEVMSLVLYKRSGQIPRRDLIFIAAADEEAGGQFGIEWLLGQDISGLDQVEYVINEGGEGKLWNGIPVFSCQNGEKGVLWLKLTVKGLPGHASMPSKTNAIQRMATIISRLNRRKQVMTLSQTSREFLSGLARKRGLKLTPNSAAVDYSLKMFVNRHFHHERSVQAMLYNTVTPTVIKAGEKTNVLAETCELTLDCRLLPGETPEGFLTELQQLVNDSEVEYEVLHSAAPTESSSDTQLYRVMEQVVRQTVPEAILVPYLSPGGTDSRYFRQRGVTAYGFMPIMIDETELQRMHGIDERLSLDNLEMGTQILYQVVEEIARG